MIGRRFFLLAAPAIVAAPSLMKVSTAHAWIEPDEVFLFATDFRPLWVMGRAIYINGQRVEFDNPNKAGENVAFEHDGVLWRPARPDTETRH